MILCINNERIKDKDDLYRKVVLQADTSAEATELPTTGAGITDLPDSISLYPSSICLCLEDSKRYVLGGDMVWHEVE